MQGYPEPSVPLTLVRPPSECNGYLHVPFVNQVPKTGFKTSPADRIVPGFDTGVSDDFQSSYLTVPDSIRGLTGSRCVDLVATFVIKHCEVIMLVLCTCSLLLLGEAVRRLALDVEQTCSQQVAKVFMLLLLPMMPMYTCCVCMCVCVHARTTAAAVRVTAHA